MRAKVLDLSGDVAKEIELPPTFNEFYRPDIIKKAVLASQANRRQTYGPSSTSGIKTSAESWGSGRGVAQVPRLKNSSRVARVPQAVGGRKAHPPKPEKIFSEKINGKERKKAMRSAIAATSMLDLVKARGHRYEGSLPLVVVDAFQELSKTKELTGALKQLQVWDDIVKAKSGRKIRAGKGKRRGRRYKNKKSILIVSAKPLLAARNLPGVDITTANNLNVELLAPGAHGGRLTIWTESAVNALVGF
jgi:large subunit ribosomal protein L4e